MIIISLTAPHFVTAPSSGRGLWEGRRKDAPRGFKTTELEYKIRTRAAQKMLFGAERNTTLYTEQNIPGGI